MCTEKRRMEYKTVLIQVQNMPLLGMFLNIRRVNLIQWLLLAGAQNVALFRSK